MSGPSSRDWDKELADIDKLIAKTPAKASGPTGPPAKVAKGKPVPTETATPPRRGSVTGTRLRVGLGVLLGAAVTQWPYPNQCGVGLFVYLGTLGMVVFTGGWAARATWLKRIGLAHVVAMGVVFWGLALIVRLLLPRLGYASEPLAWFCK